MLLGKLPTPLLIFFIHDATRAYAFATYAILAPGALLGWVNRYRSLDLHLPLLVADG